MAKMTEIILNMLPCDYEKFAGIMVYDYLREKEIIELNCTPTQFYSNVSPGLLIREGFSEYSVYLVSYLLNGAWVENYNKLSKDSKEAEFHFCFEKVPEAVKKEKFISWLKKREKTGGRSLVSRIRVALESGKFSEDNPNYFSVLDVFNIPPRELYKCTGVGRGSIEMLKNHFMDVGLDWFHYHKFDISVLK